ncbi:hypothetical protein [Kordia sp.]|uniref:hypothetical protein n=1 Tax=Kordia sp. TaxID=1965332 RepID=UPI0025C45072|nr:hypothetical protein [Kordia sp.]MCH2192667.1 hypothetical protein [Kordia sp.]
MKKSESFIENRIKWKASQYNLPNERVFLFEGLDKQKRAQYMRQISREKTGKIVLLFTDSEDNWTAVGTKMIIGYDGERMNSISLDEIQRSTSKSFYELQFMVPKSQKRIQKELECELLIIDKRGNKKVFITDKGSDFFALFNIVLMLSRLCNND